MSTGIARASPPATLIAAARDRSRIGQSRLPRRRHDSRRRELRAIRRPQRLDRRPNRSGSALVAMADALKDAGLPCPIVSTGSTPTAFSATDTTGITEIRAGVYLFFDLCQAGIGVCGLDDIALSVLTTVIGHQDDKGWAIVDAGWMALSQDREHGRPGRRPVPRTRLHGRTARFSMTSSYSAPTRSTASSPPGPVPTRRCRTSRSARA